MGMPECGPDTFGLIEYYVTEVYSEVIGSNVRMTCGVKRHGQIHWLYSVVVPAERLIIHSRNCMSAAAEAITFVELAGLTAH